jgi:hypothetical protein
MKCPECGEEYSTKVCIIHMKICKGNQEVEVDLTKCTKATLTEIAEDKGIEITGRPTNAQLIELIKGV